MNLGEASFRDREDTGGRLAGRLVQYRDDGRMIFALPGGGVPVG
jgi:predicted phosphoribosyltransferase